MSIDADLIVRQAREVARLELDPTRAAELAHEINALIKNVLAASESIAFEDEPGQFTSVLNALRDRDL